MLCTVVSKVIRTHAKVAAPLLLQQRYGKLKAITESLSMLPSSTVPSFWTRTFCTSEKGSNIEGSSANELKLFTKTHEYLSIDSGEETAKLGITSVAVHELGEVAFVELPAVGSPARKGEVIATVASVKAVGDVYSPVDGTVIEVNELVENDPIPVNDDPENHGWFLKLKFDVAGIPSNLLTKVDYDAHCASETDAH